MPHSDDAAAGPKTPAGAVVDGPIPKHQQLRAILLAELDTRLAPGDPVPSERELAARYHVSRATVRETIGQLVSEGHLRRVPGKGTFVAEPRVESVLHLASFTADMTRRGLVAGTRVLAVAEVPADRRLADALAVDPGAPLIRVERLRSADGIPMAHERSHYPAARVPDLTEADLTGSIYALLEQRYQLGPLRGEQVVSARGADPVLATLLGIHTGAPLLVFDRVTASGAGVPVEHALSAYRGDRYQLRMALDPAPAS